MGNVPDWSPADTEPDPEIILIRDNWEFFAAMAWTGYLQHGRGATVIDEGSQTNDLSEVKYVPGAIWPEDESVVETYDPRSEIIVVFLHGDQGWNLHKVES